MRSLHHRELVLGSLLTLALATVGVMAIAGPLNPPAGAVSSTYKTLTEVEPRIAINATNTPGDADSLFKITQPGSYYLTGNITGVSGKGGIEVASDNVSIDLCGFAVVGVTGSLSGIMRDGTPRGSITLKNGVVSNWGHYGVNLPYVDSSGTKGFVIDSIISRANNYAGFAIGDASIVTRCSASQNGSAGFDGGNHARYENCIATGNLGTGFLDGFGCAYSGCESRGNTGSGYVPNGNCAFTNCSASTNGLDGFNLYRCTVLACDASFNTGRGFAVTLSTIQSSGANSNTAGGIEASNSTTLLNNNVYGGTNGILITGSDNRIEGNNVSLSTTCISVTGTGNLIIRNSASNGTRYSIAAGNTAGPIVTSAGIGTLTNPAANFDF
ncbi:MAG: hypothetical protein IT432_16715 [Phycisphaerales bacterium]|nr:hypothetical protein [Phycisphaerales bacterium]